ncbi:B12-binding domain-containing radical SAM protein [bacterium SCSIO 12741]|nr:B12-binding domain-containing radical SAM protein [bacterium SCSIO 12741]
MKKAVLLFNPRSARHKYRVPNSILQVAASIDGNYEYAFVDGNLESDPWSVIKSHLDSGKFGFFGSTVMPGPQLKEAIPFTQKIRKEYPNIVNIWGGYFASNQCDVVLRSGAVDYVINGPGDSAFPALLDAIDNDKPVGDIQNLIYLEEGKVVKTRKEVLPDMDKLPPLPYEKMNSFYPLENYLGKTFMGSKTFALHTSFGCPFTCSFCAVVPIYNARWKGQSAEAIYRNVTYLKEKIGINGIEFHDNNFFTSQKRTAEFSKLILNDGIEWWGEGRIDTIDRYSDENLALMREAGCRMIFLGAESGNDEVLAQMDKGGTQSAEQILSFAGRMKKFDIVPEYSFVLGMPGPDEDTVMRQVEADIDFIKQVKEVNPDTEIIIYLYSPVPTEGSDLYKQITEAGFNFPENLEDWLNPSWENFDLRKNPLTPWLTPKVIDRVQNFETVLNGYYPTQSDFRIKGVKKGFMRTLASWRYRSGVYGYPYEIKALHKIWKYRQPEIEGFYSE